MSTQYTDVYIRDSVDDTGITPRTTPFPWKSPDIIPFGVIGCGDISQLIDDYDNPSESDYKPVEGDQYNYIYVRVKNLDSKPQSGTVYLFYAGYGSLLLTPNTWKNNPISSDGINSPNFTNLSPGGIYIAGFKWNPSIAPIGSPHSCLIAYVETPDDPVTIPGTFSSNTQFEAWVSSNPNVAWRNVDLQNNKPQKPINEVLQFNNASSNSSKLAIWVDVDNFIPGTTISVVSSDNTGTPLQDPPISESVTVGSTGLANIVSGNDFPPSYQGFVNVTITLPGSGLTLPQNATITFLTLSLDAPDSDAIKPVTTFKSLGIPDSAHTYDSNTQVTPVGGYEMIFRQQG